MEQFDVIVIGGGPAGMSAALVLARARRKVLVVDSGHPRNASARAVHGFLTRDGTAPQEFRRLAHEELERYRIPVLAARAAGARAGPCFEVLTEDGERFECKKLLVATGVVDVLPDIDRIKDFYGKGVHHCPYCDGLEYADRHIAVVGEGDAALALSLSLRTWTERVSCLTQGAACSRELQERAERHGIKVEQRRIVSLDGGDSLEALVLDDGIRYPCDALFFSTGKVQRSSIPGMLGCDYETETQVRTRGAQRTNVPGLFIAGDADGDVQFMIVAAAEGATAAVAINHDLQQEERA